MHALDEGKEAGLKDILACLREFDEAEGLEPTLRGPHGEHDLRALADGSVAKVEDELDFQFFVERHLQVHETAAGGKLMQLAAHLTLVGKTNQG